MGHNQGRSRLPLAEPGRVQPDVPRFHPTAWQGLAMAGTSPSERPLGLLRGHVGLFGVIMPGLAHVAPAFNLFVTTGLMVGLAGASAPLVVLISMVGIAATASSLAQFSGVYPSAGSFITYIKRA